MKTLEGKVAIVAGGARDIGRAVSEELAARGAKVVVNFFHSSEDGEATVSAIESAGGTAISGLYLILLLHSFYMIFYFICRFLYLY